MSVAAPLVRAIKDPDVLSGFGAKQWNTVLRQAQDCGMAARLFHRLEASGHIGLVPDRARQVMQDAVVDARHNHTALAFEINRVQRALSTARISFIVLKGGAYLCAGLPISGGRLATDLDFLVHEEDLGAAKQCLLSAGWRVAVETEYDKRYYEDWMHEIAPMAHAERQTVVDVHHAISPRTGRVHPDVAALWAASVEPEPGVRVLAPADMVLHAALHLLNEEFTAGFRDLVDLHDLLLHFGAEPGFWRDIELGAERHGLERVFYYLVSLTSRILETPIPESTLAKAQAAAPVAPLGPAMIRMMEMALLSGLARRQSWLTSMALGALYLRSHWLRMPPPLLVRHLSVKAWFRIRATLPGASAT